MTLVISIQSQVVHGHVGNSAAVYPMQAEGVTVAAVPTTLLSNHPGYPTLRGRVLEAELVADLLIGVEERGLVLTAQALLTGYLGSPAVGAVVADFLARSRRTNPALPIICDPVLGDDDLGVFVAEGMLAVMRDLMTPQAAVMTPNQFELELLTGLPARTEEDLLVAAGALAARGPSAIVATGCTLADTKPGEVETVLWQREAALVRIATPRLPIRPCGTGDLVTALMTAHLAKGAPLEAAVRAAVAGTLRVLERTMAAGTEEMCLHP